MSMDAVVAEPPRDATLVPMTPLDVDVSLKTFPGPGFLDIAWRVPVSLVTIPLDLVWVVASPVLFALGFHH